MDTTDIQIADTDILVSVSAKYIGPTLLKTIGIFFRMWMWWKLIYFLKERNFETGNRAEISNLIHSYGKEVGWSFLSSNFIFWQLTVFYVLLYWACLILNILIVLYFSVSS